MHGRFCNKGELAQTSSHLAGRLALGVLSSAHYPSRIDLALTFMALPRGIGVVATALAIASCVTAFYAVSGPRNRRVIERVREAPEGCRRERRAAEPLRQTPSRPPPALKCTICDTTFAEDTPPTAREAHLHRCRATLPWTFLPFEYDESIEPEERLST